MDSVIVHPEVTPVGKPLPALVAGERPFPHVNVPLVSPQVPAAGKTFATLGAAERPLPRVRAGVYGELGGSEEALVAELAGMQSDSGVTQEVSALVRRVGETLGAVRARIRPSTAPTRGREVAQVVSVSQGERLQSGLRSEGISAAKRSDALYVTDQDFPTAVVSGPPLRFARRGLCFNLSRLSLPQALSLHRVLIGVLVLRLLLQERERDFIFFVGIFVRSKTGLKAGGFCVATFVSWS